MPRSSPRRSTRTSPRAVVWREKGVSSAFSLCTLVDALSRVNVHGSRFACRNVSVSAMLSFRKMSAWCNNCRCQRHDAVSRVTHCPCTPPLTGQGKEGQRQGRRGRGRGRRRRRARSKSGRSSRPVHPFRSCVCRVRGVLLSFSLNCGCTRVPASFDEMTCFRSFSMCTVVDALSRVMLLAQELHTEMTQHLHRIVS